MKVVSYNIINVLDIMDHTHFADRVTALHKVFTGSQPLATCCSAQWRRRCDSVTLVYYRRKFMNIEIVREILASDIINWCFAAIGGAIAYFLFHKMQNSRERHTMIKDVEDSISSIMDMKFAMSKTSDENSLEMVNFRTILHDFSDWKLYEKNNVRITEGQRYILIRDDEKYYELIGTVLIHESLIWFRRVNKLYNCGIITNEDIADLWRQILPFVRANKLEFFRNYLGEDDTYPILAVSMHCINACYKYKRKTAIKYIEDMVKETTVFNEYISEFNNKWIIKKMFIKRKINNL